MKDNKPEPKCTLSDAELIDRCSEWVDKLCKSGGQAWSLRVPVDFERDPDILISELIQRFKSERERTLNEVEDKVRKLKPIFIQKINDVPHQFYFRQDVIDLIKSIIKENS
jgi:hypothetical protein